MEGLRDFEIFCETITSKKVKRENVKFEAIEIGEQLSKEIDAIIHTVKSKENNALKLLEELTNISSQHLHKFIRDNS